ncbi:MAG: hypothetical protein F6K30_03165 [Cyanothece sp. SIO2G6]|nr:hypothetical protein [Cyanothece sp. SIO2G6]
MDNKNVVNSGDQGERSLPAFSQPSEISEKLDTVEETFRTLAQQYEGDPIALLALLRRLETIHVNIRETLFQDSLPNNRQRLYALLRDIEVQGGWPHIPRMKLQRFLARFWDDEAPGQF